MTTLTRRTPWIAAALIASMLGGCYYRLPGGSRDPATSTTDPSYDPTVSANATVSGGYLEGTMGQITSFAAGTTIQVSGGGSYTNVRLDAENTSARWWAMTSVSIQGGLNHPSLQVGSTFVFDHNADYGGNLDALNVSVLGCSGPAHGNYTFDHSADRVEVSVAAGPRAGLNVMSYTAYFAGPAGTTQRVDGSFMYEIP